MNRLRSLFAVALFTSLVFPASGQPKKTEGVYTNPAAAGPDYTIQGEYTARGHGAQVVARGNDQPATD
jgi:hypothetical protein